LDEGAVMGVDSLNGVCDKVSGLGLVVHIRELHLPYYHRPIPLENRPRHQKVRGEPGLMLHYG